MDKEPISTDQKPAQLSLCSTLSKKLCCSRSPRGYQKVKDCSNPKLKQDNSQTNDDNKKKKENKKGNDKKEVTIALKKIMKSAAYLPKALQSPIAYEKGKKSCESCNMDKTTYKTVMKSVKIVELIVEDVIKKEQSEMIDKEDEQEDKNESNQTNGKKGEKKISIQCEIYSQKNIDHNLKCVLLRLQKTIGDVLLQLSYCKTKKSLDDERCKQYDVSMNVIEHLKFEYTSLTNSIIRLFKPPPSKQKTSPNVCVLCMKEELTECTAMLEGLLKSGRNLKVTMRNDDGGKDKCCSRNYPHVHATVQDKNVVLKFDWPFELTPSSQNDDSQEKDLKGTPYDEWPEHFDPKPTEEKPIEDNQPRTEDKNTPSLSDKSNKSLNSDGSAAETSHIKQPTSSNTTLKENSSQATKSSKNESSVNTSPCELDPNSSKDKPPGNPADNPSPSKPDPNSSKDKPSDNPADNPSPSKLEPKPSETESAAKSPSGLEPSPSKSKSSASSGLGPSAKDQSGTSPENDKFCGCNYDDVYEKLDTQKKENEDPNKPKVQPSAVNQSKKQDSRSSNLEAPTAKQNEKTSIDSDSSPNSPPQRIKKKNINDRDSDSYSDLNSGSLSAGSDDFLTPVKRQKQVSFMTENKNQKIYYVKGLNNDSTFQTEEKLFSSYRKQPDRKVEGSDLSMNTSLIGGTGRESNIPAVDSVVLAKNKNSISRNSKSPKNIYAQECGTKQAQSIESKMADLEKINSSRSLNKQQVSELLKDLGATKLLSVSFPAECCKNNRVYDFQSISDLPFSASLHSLPLDQDDLNHITQAVETLVSNENIRIIPEWEIGCMENLKEGKENKLEWHKTFSAKDAASNICIEIKTDKPVIRKRVSKSSFEKEIENLPTIKEEDEERLKKMFLSKDKSDYKVCANSQKKDLKTTELRFFTVEYSNIKHNNITFEEGRKAKSKPYSHHHKLYKDWDEYFKVNPLSHLSLADNFDTGYTSNNSLNLCSYLVEEKNSDFGTKYYLNRGTRESNLSPFDEMIMLNVIHLASSDSKPLNVYKTSSKLMSSCDSAENVKLKNDRNIMTPRSNLENFIGTKTSEESGCLVHKNRMDKNYTQWNFKSREDCGCDSGLDSSLKTSFKDLRHWKRNYTIEDCTCNNIKSVEINSMSHTSTEAINSEKIISKGGIEENNENNRTPNSSPKSLNTVIDTTGAKDHDKKYYLKVNKETLDPIFSCTNIEQNEGQCLTGKQVCNQWPGLKKLGKSIDDETSTRNTSETKITQPQCQNVVFGFNEKKETLKGCLDLNLKNAHVEITNLHLKRHNLNRRSYFISKKPVVRILSNLIPSNVTTNQYKPTIINEGTTSKSLKFKISKPGIKFPRISNLVLSNDVTIWKPNQKNHNHLNLEDFGLSKSYMKVSKTEEVGSESNSFNLMDHISGKKNHKKSLPFTIKGGSQLDFKLATGTSVDFPFNDSGRNEFPSKQQEVFNLFDVNGVLVTDGLGRNVQTISNEMLLKPNKASLPLYGLQNSPVFDSEVCLIKEEVFEPCCDSKVGSLTSDSTHWEHNVL